MIYCCVYDGGKPRSLESLTLIHCDLNETVACLLSAFTGVRCCTFWIMLKCKEHLSSPLSWSKVYLNSSHLMPWEQHEDHPSHTVDGRNPANQLRLVVYPIIYMVFYIPGGAGFLPSTVPLVLGSSPRYALLPEREIIESPSIVESNPSGTTALHDFQRLAVIIVDGSKVLRDFQLQGLVLLFGDFK